VTLAELIRRTTLAQREAKRTATKKKRVTARQLQEAAAGPDDGGYTGPWEDDEDEDDGLGPRHGASGALTVPLDADGNDLVVAHPSAVALVPQTQPQAPAQALPMAPQVQVVNGRIVVNEHSLTVVQLSQGDGAGPSGALVRSGQAPVLNSNSNTSRQRVEKWGVQDTALFYRALSQFGTDFSLIERLFPGRTRHQIKNKFTSEERLAPDKVDAALRDRTGGGGTGAGGISSVQAYKDMIESLKRSQAEEQARHERLQQAAIAAAAKQAEDAAAAEAASRAERDKLVAAADERRHEANQARAASAAAAAAAPPPVLRQPPKEATTAAAAVAAPPKAAKPKARKQRVNLLAEPGDMAPPASAAAAAAPKAKAVAVPPLSATAPGAPGRSRGVMDGDACVAAGEAAVRRALAGLGK
jgi:transcription factor TFIIIB component B''